MVPGPPLKNYKNIGFLSNTCLGPLKNHKATKPVFNVPQARRKQLQIGGGGGGGGGAHINFLGGTHKFFFGGGGGHICANYGGEGPPVPPYSYGPVPSSACQHHTI